MPRKNFIDLTGQVFNRLTVLSRADNSKHGQARWLCRCTCGTELITGGRAIRKNLTKSCGCLKVERGKVWKRKHGFTGYNEDRHPLYTLYYDMKARCLNKNHGSYLKYKKREICKEWLGDTGFIAFKDWAYGKYPNLDKLLFLKYQLDRENNSLGYFPQNCRFITPGENVRNRDNSIFCEYNGERLVAKDMCKKYGIITYSSFLYRIKKLKWTIEEALLTLPYMSKGTYE